MALQSNIFKHFSRLVEIPDYTDLRGMSVLARCLHTGGLSAVEANTSHQCALCGLASWNVYCCKNVYFRSYFIIFSFTLCAGACAETSEPSASSGVLHLS